MISSVYYIEPKDITSSGTLKPNVTKGKKSIVMVHSNSCGHCIQAKPAFEELSTQRNDINTLAIQLDDPDSLPHSAVKDWYPEFQGVPVFFLFDSEGNFQGVHNGNRDSQSLGSSVDAI